MGRMSQLSPLKYATFAVISLLLATVVINAALLGLDLYLHKRYEKRWGLNVWGYRGPVVGPKRPGGVRIVVLGGSTALGFGVPPHQAIPAYLEEKLNLRRRHDGSSGVSVVNLAYNAEGAYSFIYTLQAYEYLGYDVAVLYTGVNDVGRNTRVFRHSDPVFRMTGYDFMLPRLLQERALFIRYRGDLDAAARGDKIVFTPSVAERTTAATPETAAATIRRLESYVARVAQDEPPADSGASDECGPRWSFYCNSILRAVDYLLSRRKCVVVVSEPYLGEIQVDQQQTMVSMLRRRFGDHPNLWHVDVGRAVDIHDPAVAFDGMHLTPAGNAKIAEQLVDPMLAVLARAGPNLPSGRADPVVHPPKGLDRGQ